MSDPAENIHDPILRWVTFRLGDEAYGINVMQVREVLRISEIAPVPGSPDYVIGIINLRGNVVTVIETRHKFGLRPINRDDAARIVIIETDDQVIGIMVDAVSEVVDLAESQIDLAPNVGNEETSRYIEGVSSQQGELLILVNLNNFLIE